MTFGPRMEWPLCSLQIQRALVCGALPFIAIYKCEADQLPPCRILTLSFPEREAENMGCHESSRRVSFITSMESFSNCFERSGVVKKAWRQNRLAFPTLTNEYSCHFFCFFCFFSVAVLIYNRSRNVFVFVKQFRPGEDNFLSLRCWNLENCTGLSILWIEIVAKTSVIFFFFFFSSPCSNLHLQCRNNKEYRRTFVCWHWEVSRETWNHLRTVLWNCGQENKPRGHRPTGSLGRMWLRRACSFVWESYFVQVSDLDAW